MQEVELGSLPVCKSIGQNDSLTKRLITLVRKPGRTSKEITVGQITYHISGINNPLTFSIKAVAEQLPEYNNRCKLLEEVIKIVEPKRGEQ